MSRLSNLTFGDADHLPGAEALSSLEGTWHTENLLVAGEGATSSVARLRDYPEAVVRIQHTEYGADEIALGMVAQTGIRHFKQMQEAGLHIPPQRFVIAPSVFTDEDYPCLYSFTDRLHGRELTSDPTDADYATTTIDGLAKYLAWVHSTEEPVVLWDKAYSWQFTVQDTGDTVLHDVGLDFQDAWKSRGRVGLDLYLPGLHLLDWAHNAGVERPKSLVDYMHSIESWPKRLAREVMWKITRRYAMPTQE